MGIGYELNFCVVHDRWKPHAKILMGYAEQEWVLENPTYKICSCGATSAFWEVDPRLYSEGSRDAYGELILTER